MKSRDKASIALLVTLIVVVVGGMACTYGTTGAVDPILAIALVVLVLVTAGAIACSYSKSKTASGNSR